MVESPREPNRLVAETSPYLLQHAHNPVDWYPWGEEALARARREDQPILLSIGYSACHWCHVMERESFEDADVAALMNDGFVCIKVDREERPDLDKIYQLAHQMLTQRPGGWPLTLVLSPHDHAPIFAGTYFPREPRYGMPGFEDVLRRVAAHYHANKHRLEKHTAAVADAFRQIEPPAPAAGTRPDAEPLAQARRELEGQYDAEHGGFGAAPKFPHPTQIEFLLRHWARTAAAGEADARALEMATHTLRAMADGGIYDQLGGGFCRYSVDERWMIPHFEKMLYDNAQLLSLYSDAAKATGDADLARVAVETAEWVMRDMQSAEGGYYSSLDADSEGEEGKFYVWTLDEVRGPLSDAEADVVVARYGLDGRPNFEGKWHLNVHAPLAAVAARLELDAGQAEARLDAARDKLLAVRNARVWPGRDEKILTSWNAMMIKGMAHAGRFLGRADFVDSAARSLDFVRRTLWADGRLLATTRDGRSRLNAYLDDYVLLIDALLELSQARWRDGDLAFAVALADAVLAHFEDAERGGFFFTSDDHEPLLHRHKPTTDDAVPSGNGVAATVLLRLGHVLGEPRYLEAAERTLRALYAGLERYPSAHGSALVALEEYVAPTQTVVLRGDEAALAPWTTLCHSGYAPRRVTLSIADTAAGLPGTLAERRPGAAATAYVCEGFTCSPPITELEALRARLETHAAS